MCLIDSGDGPVNLLRSTWQKARIAHKCKECGRQIRPGESYSTEAFVFERDFNLHKTCAHCLVVRDWLQAECGGYLYGAVEEDIREHAYEGYGMAVKRLAVGMGRNWQRKDGSLYPVPKTPPTTDELMKAKAA